MRELKGEEIGPVDIISGGYPCQPFSVAGGRRGEEDDRHLWPEFARLIREAKPRYVVCENVAGHISMGLDQVLSDLEGLGYTWEAFVIPACAADAPHRRDRVWIIANAMRRRDRNGETVNKPALDEERNTEAHREGRAPIAGETRRDDSMANTTSTQRQRGTRAGNVGTGWQTQRPLPVGTIVADTDFALSEGNERTERGTEERADDIEHCRWPPEPAICRVVDGVRTGVDGYLGRVATGVPNRTQRLKGLGNAIVPQVAEVIFQSIKERDNVSQ